MSGGAEFGRKIIPNSRIACFSMKIAPKCIMAMSQHEASKAIFGHGGFSLLNLIIKLKN
jgi:hypothetical protein